jgi:uncharacterized ferredoxin-like protein
MTRTSSVDAEYEALRTVANLMAAAARTAPKGRGVDTIRTMVVEGEDIATIARAMDEVAPGRADIVTNAIRRDAGSVRASTFVVLIGVSGAPKKPEKPFDCGACGLHTCANMIHARERAKADSDYFGPNCVIAALDLGVALGSAVKVASDHNIDNRLMYTMGIAVAKLKWMDADVVIGIPLSTTGKSMYFDRA